MSEELGEEIVDGEGQEPEAGDAEKPEKPARKKAKRKATKRKATTKRSTRSRKAAAEEAEPAEADPAEAEAAPDADDAGDEASSGRSRRRRTPEEKEARRLEVARKLGRDEPEEKPPVLEDTAALAEEATSQFGVGLVEGAGRARRAEAKAEVRDEDAGRRDDRGRDRAEEPPEPEERDEAGDEARDEDRDEEGPRRGRRRRGRRRGGRRDERDERDEREEREEREGRHEREDEEQPPEPDQGDRDEDGDEDEEHEDDEDRPRSRERGNRRRRDRDRDRGRRGSREKVEFLSLPHNLRQHPTQRVGVLCDFDSLEGSARGIYQGHLSAMGLLSQILGGRKAPRAIAYLGKESQALRHTLAASGFDTIQVVKTRERALVQLAVDAIALAPRVDTLVLATADDSLAPLAQHLRSQGVKVEFACFGNDLQSLRQSQQEEPLSLGRESVLMP
ncbi:MAG: NYN domain-containing protein [Planctomycetota bacterium]